MGTLVKGPEWAHGCEKCRFGIVFPTELSGADSLYMERLAQAVDGIVEFCDCKAGHMYRQHLRAEYRRVEKLSAGINGSAQGVANMLLDQARRALDRHAERQADKIEAGK